MCVAKALRSPRVLFKNSAQAHTRIRKLLSKIMMHMKKIFCMLVAVLATLMSVNLHAATKYFENGDYITIGQEVGGATFYFACQDGNKNYYSTDWYGTTYESLLNTRQTEMSWEVIDPNGDGLFTLRSVQSGLYLAGNIHDSWLTSDAAQALEMEIIYVSGSASGELVGVIKSTRVKDNSNRNTTGYLSYTDRFWFNTNSANSFMRVIGKAFVDPGSDPVAGAQNEYIVSIAYTSNNGKTYYYIDDNGTMKGVNKNNPESSNGQKMLWRAVRNTSAENATDRKLAFTLQNVSTGKYVRYNNNAITLVTNKDDASILYCTSNTWTDYSLTTKQWYFLDGKTKKYLASSATNSDANASTLNSEPSLPRTFTLWKTTFNINYSFAPEYKNFDVYLPARCGNLDPQRVDVNITGSEVYRRMNYNWGNRDITKAALNWNSIYLGVIWKSSNTKTSSLNTGSYDATEDVSRPLMTLSMLEGSEGSRWFTINPYGNSPHGLKKYDAHTGKNELVPFEDQVQLVFSTTVAQSSATYTEVKYMPVERLSYEEHSVNELKVDWEYDSYTFPYVASNIVANVSMRTVEGNEYVDNQDKVVYSNTTQHIISGDDWNYVTAGINNSANWLTINANGQSQQWYYSGALTPITGMPDKRAVVFSAQQNSGAGNRTATITANFAYQEPGHNRYESNQLSQLLLQVPQIIGEEGAIKFIKQKGVTNSDYENSGTGWQQAHTIENVIYYVNGQTNIGLPLQQRTFYGYMRWYDYNTGRDLRYNTLGADPNTVDEKGFRWTTEPTANGQAFTIINANAKSHGRFASRQTHTTAANGGDACNVPKFTAWNDGAEHVVACDVSMYTDYDIVLEGADAHVKEPTLSYRQKWIFRPASEIATALAATTADNYYENYKYIAPAGKQIVLTTQFRYNTAFNDASEKCYYYLDGSTYKNIGGTGVNAQWYQKIGDGAETAMANNFDGADFQKVQGTAGQKVTYSLRATANGKTYYIAQFVVDYRGTGEVGPSATELITQAQMDAGYTQLGDRINFEDRNGDQFISTGGSSIRTTPMPWEQSSFGFFYPQLSSAGQNKRHSQDNAFVHYGEYAILHSTNKSWLTATAKEGQNCMYVDGMKTPGLVATITVPNATICAGQMMFCSAWIASGKNATKPQFRFNVQGRNSNTEDWKDIGVFMSGTMNNDNNWYQVKFPLVSANDYSQVRVKIYNFAGGTDGNDFMIDDIRIYASLLPLTAYEVVTTCTDHDMLLSVIRLDYTNLTSDLAGRYIYYDIYDKNTNQKFLPICKYHQEDATVPITQAGSFRVPAKNYVPSAGNGDVIITNLMDYANDIMQKHVDKVPNIMHKAYRQEEVAGNNHWIIYLVQVMPSKVHAELGWTNAINPDHDYAVRMAQSVRDLATPQCALQADLPFVTVSHMEIDGEVTMTSGSTTVCSNNLKEAEMTLSYRRADNTVITGSCYADWLVGQPFDARYTAQDVTQSEKDAADAAFLAYYEYSRSDVLEAIRDLRRVPTNSAKNDNLHVKNVEDLVPSGGDGSGFSNDKNYQIVKKLVEAGKLILYEKKRELYTQSNVHNYFWIYPIEGTGKDLTGNDLPVCPATIWLDAVGDPDNNSVLHFGTNDHAATYEIPTVRVSQADANSRFNIPIAAIEHCALGHVELLRSNDPTAQANKAGFKHSFAINNPTVGQNVEFRTNNDNTVLMRPGFTYRVQVELSRVATSTVGLTSCGGQGYAYFDILIVPDVMTWAPVKNNDFGDDRNWIGQDNSGNNLPDSLRVAPMIHTNCIIPTLADNTMYPAITRTVRSKDIYYTTDKCHNIHLKKGAAIWGQWLLTYESAWVDMSIPSNGWYTMAAPLKNVYSGDLHTPVAENFNSSFNSAVLYPELRGRNHAFWTCYYNRTAPIYYDHGGSVETAGAKGEWNLSNALNDPIAPGVGVAIWAANASNSNTNIQVRLPKSENEYYYFYMDQDGNPIEYATDHAPVTLTRTESHKFALQFDGSGKQEFTLSNEQADEYVLFGNPSMAYIDMSKFLSDNSAVFKNCFYMMSNSSTTPYTQGVSSASEFVVPPMRSVFLEVKNPAASGPQSVKATLKPEHLVLSPSHAGTSRPAYVPSRTGEPVSTVNDYEANEIIKLYAFNEWTSASMALAKNPTASNEYVDEEDVLFFQHQYDENSGLSNDLGIYSVAGTRNLMVDMRQTIQMVPICFVLDEYYWTDRMSMVVNFPNHMSEAIYFCDSQTGDSIRLYDGMCIEFDTPAPYQLRYYLQGVTATGDITTDAENVIPTTKPDNADESKFVFEATAYNHQEGHVNVFANALIDRVTIIDPAGHVCASVSPRSQMCSIAAPQGVVLVKIESHHGTIIRKVFVK